MTNKEAIEYLGKIPIPRLMSNSLEDCIEQDKYYYAIRMGIEALKSQKTVIEELEKIKSEIKDYSKTLEFINHTTFVSEEKNKRFIELEDVNKLIAKAILELKGE